MQEKGEKVVKGYKYNVVLVSLIVIIGLLVGTSNGFLLSQPKPNEQEPPISESPVGDEQELVLPEELDQLSPDASAYERIAFASKIMNEGKGFQSVFSQEITAPATVQKIYVKQYRGEGYNLSEQWMEANISMGKFGFVSVYSDGNLVKQKEITSKADYSFKDRTYNPSKANKTKTTGASEYISNFKNLNDFPLTLNENTTDIIKYDKRADPNYYIIKLNVDATKIDKEYLNSFVDNGTGETKFSSIILTIKISKKTGYFARIEREEIFQTKFAGLLINCSSKNVQTFSAMNISAKPIIQEIASKSFASF